MPRLSTGHKVGNQAQPVGVELRVPPAGGEVAAVLNITDGLRDVQARPANCSLSQRGPAPVSYQFCPASMKRCSRFPHGTLGWGLTRIYRVPRLTGIGIFSSPSHVFRSSVTGPMEQGCIYCIGTSLMRSALQVDSGEECAGRRAPSDVQEPTAIGCTEHGGQLKVIRRRVCGPIVTRLQLVPLRRKELFYLRALLQNRPARRSAMRIAGGSCYATYGEAATAFGLDTDFRCVQQFFASTTQSVVAMTNCPTTLHESQGLKRWTAPTRPKDHDSRATYIVPPFLQDCDSRGHRYPS